MSPPINWQSLHKHCIFSYNSPSQPSQAFLIASSHRIYSLQNWLNLCGKCSAIAQRLSVGGKRHAIVFCSQDNDDWHLTDGVRKVISVLRLFRDGAYPIRQKNFKKYKIYDRYSHPKPICLKICELQKLLQMNRIKLA